MTVLVTGGAGYVGSHAVNFLSKKNIDVVVLDDLSTGHRWALDKNQTFVEANLLDEFALNTVFTEHKIDSVIHFAAKSIVSESALNPMIYFQNNISGSINLFNVMLKHNVKKIVFSSTASIYGEPNESMISEEHAQLPINVYGQTKLTIEKILKALFYSDNLCSISLRYFNAAGADPCGLIGEAHPNETHLIPNAINSLLKNNSDEFHVFGNTYNTKDGTCVRDYIHVNDLAAAHFLGLQYLKNNEVCESYNLGAGKGFSVLEILNTIEQISGKKVNFSFKEKRVGDPAILVADIKRARKDLNWNPVFSDISTIIRDAFNWHSKGT